MAIDKAAVARKEAALRGDDNNVDSVSMGVDGAGETKLKLRRSINELLSPRTPVTPPLSPDPSLNDCSDGEESLSTSSSSQLQQQQRDEDEETKRYNSYWYIHGKAYDLAPFISTHPGGEHALLLARGRDGTSLFESYHPFSQKPKEILKKYIVQNPNKEQLARHVIAAEASGWVMGKEDPFWEALKSRCGAALEATGSKSTAMPWPYFTFGICLILLQWYLYFNVFLHNGSALGGVALGAVSWMVVGMYGHEGLHYGISRKFPAINLWLGGYAMGWMSNPFIWTLQHTYAHHSFTNNHELDPDTQHFAVMLRMHKANSYRHRLHPYLIHRAYVYMFWSQTVLGMTVLLPIKTLLFQSIQGTTPLAPYKKASTAFWIGLHFVAYYLVLW
ncbi:delta 5 fatty acid desaturase [Nannochloropsis oceanica]